MQRIVIVRLNFFFFNDTATTEIYTLSLHDALPIWPALHAQTSAGAIVGVIRDSSGSVIPEAKVVITNLGTNVSSPFVTDGTGNYYVPALIPGRYKVEAEKPGFKIVTVPDVELAVSQTL